MKEKHLFIIAGPTAVGKTGLTIRLAKAYNTEILSCDSRQVYKEFNIGTAKPTKYELNKIKHHFIDHISIKDHYSAGHYEKEAVIKLDELFLKNNVVFMTGGTGLYIDAVCFGLNEFPTIEISIKNKWEHLFKTKGIGFLQSTLKLKDPEYFSKVDIHNHSRLIRALSVIDSSGKTFTSFRNMPKAKRNFNTHFVKLERARPELYHRINLRVDIMIKEGLVQEVESLINYRALKAFQTVGYQELLPYFDKEKKLEECIELIKQNSRRYAKRQLTWFRKDHYTTFHPDHENEILAFINSKIS